MSNRLFPDSGEVGEDNDGKTVSEDDIPNEDIMTVDDMNKISEKFNDVMKQMGKFYESYKESLKDDKKDKKGKRRS